LADFISIAKLISRQLISAQHGLVKVSYTTRKVGTLLTRNEVEEANSSSQGFRMENGTTSAVKHFPKNGASA